MEAAEEPRFSARVCASASLLLLPALSLLLVIIAADRPSFLASASSPGFLPAWIAGPLGGLWPQLRPSYVTLLYLVSGVMVAMFGCYAVALRFAPQLRARWTLATIVAVHVVFLLSPPLQYTDVFNYINYGRMAVVHQLNPYATIPVLEPHSDPSFYLSNWHGLRSPYGPLFTQLSEALVPLGVPASLWALKLLDGLASLASLVLIWRCAQRLGRAPVVAVVFAGLNPLVLVWGLGAAHYDSLMMFFLVLAVYLLLRAREASDRPASDADRPLTVARNGRPAAHRRWRLGRGGSAPALNPTAGAAAIAYATSIVAASAAATASGTALPGRAYPAAGRSPYQLRNERDAPRSTRHLELGAGAALAVAIAVKVSAGILLPMFLLSGRCRRILVGLIPAAAMLATASFVSFGAHLPDLTTQSSLINVRGLPDLLGFALGLGGETHAMHTALSVALIPAVALCGAWAWRSHEHWLTAAGTLMLLLVLTLSWTVPWYILWILPFAALSRSTRLRVAALVLSAYFLLAFMPAESDLANRVGFHPENTAVGHTSGRAVSALGG